MRLRLPICSMRILPISSGVILQLSRNYDKLRGRRQFKGAFPTSEQALPAQISATEQIPDSVIVSYSLSEGAAFCASLSEVRVLRGNDQPHVYKSAEAE